MFLPHAHWCKKNQNICARKCNSFVFKDNIMTISFASVHFFADSDAGHGKISSV